MPLLTTLHTVRLWGGCGGLVWWEGVLLACLRKYLLREKSARDRPGKGKYMAASDHTPQFFKAAKGTFFQATVNLK